MFILAQLLIMKCLISPCHTCTAPQKAWKAPYRGEVLPLRPTERPDLWPLLTILEDALHLHLLCATELGGLLRGLLIDNRRATADCANSHCAQGPCLYRSAENQKLYPSGSSFLAALPTAC